MTRFILLATGRTGTTLIGNSLADHPEVLYYGELFHRDLRRRADEAARVTVGAGVLRQLGAGLPLCRNEDDGAAYLSRLYAPHTGAHAAGFKLFYRQARAGAAASAWRYLESDAGLHVAHLQRADWLGSLISYERALRSRIWHASGNVETAPFRLDASRCREHFERLEASPALIEPLLRGRAVLDVEYADLAADFRGVMARICAFLGVDPALAGPARIAKIARRPPREEICNYDALRREFLGTRYARFFGDG